MSAIKHFVITRIGLGIYSENRLQKVLDLFEAVTLSSLANQSSQEFFSLLAIDSDMPPAAHAKLKALIEGRPNFLLVPIDVKGLIHVHVGGFDWIWDHCQDFILRRCLLEDPFDYVISSVLDADDAWHRDVISSINNLSLRRLPEMRALEAQRNNTWLRHSAGMAVTFPLGHIWYVAVNRLEDMTMPFHSMAVFVTARFSSGISACSSRHSQWQEYSKVLQFEVSRANADQHMWVYGRHDEAVVSWNAFTGKRIDPEVERDFLVTFGIDMEKVRSWRSAYPNSSKSSFLGQSTTAEQYDRIFRIANLNRKLQALRTKLDEPSSDCGTLKKEIERCAAQRQQLIEKLKGMQP